MIIESKEVNGFTVKIMHDEEAPSPRESMTDGCGLALFHKRYDLPNDSGLDPDDFPTEQAFIDALKEKTGALIVARVYGYDHSGLSMSVSRAYPYDDPWDSGVLGVGYVTPQNWSDTQGESCKWENTPEQQAQAMQLIKGDIETYNMWANGEVYCYSITDFDGEIVDSCSDIYGLDDTVEEAVSAAQSLEHEPKCNGRLDRRRGVITHSAACAIHRGSLPLAE